MSADKSIQVMSKVQSENKVTVVEVTQCKITGQSRSLDRHVTFDPTSAQGQYRWTSGPCPILGENTNHKQLYYESVFHKEWSHFNRNIYKTGQSHSVGC